MNVLSLFDGMSCGRLALERSGIVIDNYYASEIDKYSIRVSVSNYPDIVQLGSVIGVEVGNLPKIDLLIGGSPCQSFSFAGKKRGMSTKDNVEILSLIHYLELRDNGFEFEGQSYLFWEYMRILEEIRVINPQVKFLLENVMMGNKWQKVLTRAIGINPIEINSSLVSAQNRRRLYWTNIGAEADGLFGDLRCMIGNPADRGVLLKDILERDVDEKYYLRDNIVKKMNLWEEKNKINGNGFKMEYRSGHQKSATLPTGPMKSSSTYIKIDKNGKEKNNQDKASCFTAGGNSGGNHSDMDLIKCVAMRGRDPENPRSRKPCLNTEQMIEARIDEKTNCLTSVQKDNLIYTTNYLQYDLNGFGHGSSDQRAYYENGKSGTLDTGSGSKQHLLLTNRIRRLTPTECERLQTVPDNYTVTVSDSQRYKMLGNGWTVDIIAHIFSYLNK